MNSLDTEFHRRILKKISDAYNAKAESVCSGALDHLTYKQASGYMLALRYIQDWCAEVETDMNKGD